MRRVAEQKGGTLGFVTQSTGAVWFWPGIPKFLKWCIYEDVSYWLFNELCWNFRTIYGGWARNRVVVPARQPIVARRAVTTTTSTRFLAPQIVIKFQHRRAERYMVEFFLSFFIFTASRPTVLQFFYFLHKLSTQKTITHEDKITLYIWFFDDP